MLQPVYTRQFNKDVRRVKKSGSKDIEKLKTVIRILLEERPLDIRHRDHKLKGDYIEHRECHIEPDWLLVYKVSTQDKTITFVRTGSHAELFE